MLQKVRKHMPKSVKKHKRVGKIVAPMGVAKLSYIEQIPYTKLAMPKERT